MRGYFLRAFSRQDRPILCYNNTIRTLLAKGLCAANLTLRPQSRSSGVAAGCRVVVVPPVGMLEGLHWHRRLAASPGGGYIT